MIHALIRYIYKIKSKQKAVYSGVYKKRGVLQLSHFLMCVFYMYQYKVHRYTLIMDSSLTLPDKPRVNRMTKDFVIILRKRIVCSLHS